MSLVASLAFPARKFVSITEDTIAYASGNGVCILTLSTNAMKFMTPGSSTTSNEDKRDYLGGISALGSSGTTSQLAIAARSLQPCIDVYDYPSMNKAYTLEGGAELDFADITFSANGGRVAAISKLPDFSICVWDTRTQKIICRATLAEPCTTISFNPLKDDQLCVHGEKGLFLWTMKETQQEGIQLESIKLRMRALLDDDEEDSGGEQEEDDEDFEEAQGPRNDFVCHCWSVNGNVHAATRAGEAFTLTFTGAQIIETFPAFYTSSGATDAGPPNDDEPRLVARAMYMTKAHIVVVFSDGKVRWLQPSGTYDIHRVVNLSSFSDTDASVAMGMDDLGLDDGLDGNKSGEGGGSAWVVPITSCLTPGHLTISIGTADGMILSLPTGIDEITDPDDFEIEVFAEGGSEVIVNKHIDVHADSVYAMSPVKNQECVLTAAADGSVRLWDAKHGALLHKTILNSQPFVCSSSSSSSSLVALGSVDGVVRLLLVTRQKKSSSVIIVYEEKLFGKAVTQLDFHPTQPILSVTSMAEGRIYLLDVRPTSFGPFTTCSTDRPYATAWCGSEKMLVASGDGILRQATLPSLPEKAVDIDTLRTSPFTLETRGKFARGSVLSMVVDQDGKTLYVANDASKSLERFVLAEECGGVDAKLVPAGQHALHVQPVLSVVMHQRSNGVSMLATGGKSGTIGVWRTENGEARLVKEIRGHSAGVVRMCFTGDGERLMTSSVDGSVSMWEVGLDAGASPPAAATSGSYPSDEFYAENTKNLLVEDFDEMSDDVGSRVSFMERIEASDREVVGLQNEEKKAETLSKFHAFRLELQGLMNHNMTVDELERLETDEFIVNLEERDRLEREGDERSKIVEQRIQQENATRRVIWKRLMSELWNSMEYKGREICSVKVGLNLKVTNFPVPVVTTERQTTYDRALMHRRIELREITQAHRTTVWPGVSEETNSGSPLTWMVNEGKLAPDPDVKTPEQILALEAEAAANEDGNKDNEDRGGGSGDGGDGDGSDAVTKEEELLDMLYRPLALRTNAQKRIQILLLEQLIREMKISFNKKFDDCFGTKEEKLDEIRNKNTRIQEILNELKVQEEYFKPQWNSSEFPERVVEVKDTEVPVEKYISEAERKKMADDEEERIKNAAANQGDNAPERALMEMMGGTLEEEQGLNALEQELVREEWMDELLFDEMSEDQRKMLEDFEARQKALLEEKEKYRKGLELELKKLRQDVSDLCRVVDEKISDLLTLKLATQMQVHVQELYSLRLVLVLMEDEDDKRELIKLRSEIADLETKRDKARAEFEAFSAQMNDKRTNVESMRIREREMEKQFKKMMTEMSPGGQINSDTLATLTSLYKSRSASGGGGGGGGGARNSLFSGFSTSMAAGSDLEQVRARLEEAGGALPTTSPYYQYQLAVASRNPEIARQREREEQMQPLDLENDVPEGFECPVEVLQKLQELRMSRIEFELNIKHAEDEMESMNTIEARLQTICVDFSSQISELQTVRSELNERIALSSTNIEVMLKLKQGRDEVKQEAVVTDYSDALLIPESIVGELNMEIRRLGEGKMTVLTKIKDFNKEINHMLWECSYLKMMVKHTEEKYLDYHMLRVTKDLQAFLKGGSGPERQRVAVDKAEATYEYMKKAHQQKLDKLTKAQKKLTRAKREKEKENGTLGGHVEELERNVSLRASIHRARAAGGDGTMADEGAAGRKRMQGIVTRRKLIDLARAQTDEIEFLRQELDRLRQRTFPSFAGRRDQVGDAY